MTARTGMSDLIQTLRMMCDAGTADFTAGTVNYWTDTQLQSQLDQRRRDHFFVPLGDAIAQVDSGGTVIYKDYQFKYGWLESGSLLFLQEAGGSVIGTADYSVDCETGHITFDNDTHGSAYYLTGRSYDINLAAADTWRRKASSAAMMYDIDTDNHDLKRSQYMVHCRHMADFYAGEAGPQSADLIRSDGND